MDHRITVSIEGTVTGLEVRDNTTRELVSTRWENAQSKWNDHVVNNLFTLAQSTAGVTLHTEALGATDGFNPVVGTITYSREYDNRPNTITGNAITEIISVSNSNAADIYAQIPIPGRPYGPILQNMETIGVKKRSINIEIQMPPSSQSYTPTEPNTNGIISSLMPVSDLGVFLEADERNWSANTGRYARTVTFIWE